jgi:hypothetical protein
MRHETSDDKKKRSRDDELILQTRAGTKFGFSPQVVAGGSGVRTPASRMEYASAQAGSKNRSKSLVTAQRRSAAVPFRQGVAPRTEYGAVIDVLENFGKLKCCFYIVM